MMQLRKTFLNVSSCLSVRNPYIIREIILIVVENFFLTERQQIGIGYLQIDQRKTFPMCCEMADFKEPRVFLKSCFKLWKPAEETLPMLKKEFGDDA